MLNPFGENWQKTAKLKGKLNRIYNSFIFCNLPLTSQFAKVDIYLSLRTKTIKKPIASLQWLCLWINYTIIIILLMYYRGCRRMFHIFVKQNIKILCFIRFPHVILFWGFLNTKRANHSSLLRQVSYIK
mgnify:CR=1 FL=1